LEVGRLPARHRCRVTPPPSLRRRTLTRCHITPMTEPHYLAAVADALGPLAKSPENPDGGQGFYVEGECRPYVIFVDEPREFKTAEEAVAKARQLRDMD